MKQITGNTLVKFIAALLCVALLVSCTWFLFFGALFTMMPRDEVVKSIMELTMEEATNMAYYHKEELEQMQKDPDGQWSSEYIQKMFDPELTNFRYQIIRNDKVILSNIDPEKEPYLAKYTNWEQSYEPTDRQREIMERYEEQHRYPGTVTDDPNVDIGHREEPPVTEEEYSRARQEAYVQYWICGYLVQSEVPVVQDNAPVTDETGKQLTQLGLAVDDRYNRMYDYLQTLAATPARQQLHNGLLSGGLALLLLIFLMMAAGRRADTDEVELRVMDRLPWDLWLFFLFCGGALICGGVWLCVEFAAYAVNQSVEVFELFILFAFVVAVLSCGFAVWQLMSFAARVKVKGWWRNCLCGRIVAICWGLCVKLVKWCWRVIKGTWNAMGSGLRKIPLIWKAAVVLGVICFAELLFCLACVWDGGWSMMGCLWVLVKFVLCLGICLALRRLKEGARTIADGALNHRVSTKYLYGDFKEHALDLNRIGDGLSRSVDSRLRAERMKTELITNVSHDLKTPLTSIVNYVDLLKKEELTGTAGEYVEVLDRQAARLKKLTEDLVEASKASTGSLNVSVERVNLSELLGQAQAEYALRLAETGLKTIVNAPAQPVEIWADGKYVWRILDNLLSNVCKYAMPDTRVYLDVRTEGDKAVLSVKNISRECLNISADELMERFVRGDSSRTTEGSGLGLSIAQSLAKLMGGQLNIVVDGDLFKAEVTLPMVK